MHCPDSKWDNDTDPYDHKCSICHEYCSLCFGASNYECNACKNVTVNSRDVVYYKDVQKTFCLTTCSDGQFIDANIPNLCIECHGNCLLCVDESINCFRCSFGFYLYVANNSCVELCPDNYYNDPIITPNNFYCTRCTPGCFLCNGPGLQACQQC